MVCIQNVSLFLAPAIQLFHIFANCQVSELKNSQISLFIWKIVLKVIIMNSNWSQLLCGVMLDSLKNRAQSFQPC